MRRPLSPALLAVALACAGKDTADSGPAPGGDGVTDGADGAGTDGGGADGASDGADGGGDSRPVVRTADAWCYEHTTGETAWLWVVEATFDDRQGLDTINPFFEDGVTVLQAGATVATYSVTCTDAGACSASFNETADGVSCASATTYTLEVRVMDEDEQWSDPLTLTGRQGAGPSGR